MLLQPVRRPESEQKLRLFLLRFQLRPNALFQLFVFDDDLPVLGEFFDLRRQLDGMAEIDDEHPEKDADKKDKIVIVQKPVCGLHQQRVQEEVEQRPGGSPQKGEEGADNALEVSPAVRVVP